MIHISSLVIFIDPIISFIIVYTSTHCQCHLHIVHTYTDYLLCIFHTHHISYYLQFSFQILSGHIHIICYVSFTLIIYPITCNLVCAYCLHTHISSIYYLHIICITLHGQHGPELSFYCDRNLLLNGICDRNFKLFYFRIMEMICKIICVDGFVCMLHLDIVDILSAYVDVIHTVCERAKQPDKGLFVTGK